MKITRYNTSMVKRRMGLKTLLLGILLLLLTNSIVSSWSNGGNTDVSNNPKYGTHDWIAETAVSFLPASESKWIKDNMVSFLIGTEAPDNSAVAEYYTNKQGYGDKHNHHNYYNANHTQAPDDSASKRAQKEYDKALDALKLGNNRLAAFYAGAMTHYITDLAVWAHVMGKDSPHGSEESNVHSDYETKINNTIKAKHYSDTNHTSSIYQHYIVFDGKYNNITAYQAAYNLGLNTDSGGGTAYDCVRMETEWQNAQGRTGESINLAANAIADVLHRLNQESTKMAEVPAPDTLTTPLAPASITLTTSTPMTFTPTTSKSEGRTNLTLVGTGSAAGLIILIILIVLVKSKRRKKV